MRRQDRARARGLSPSCHGLLRNLRASCFMGTPHRLHSGRFMASPAIGFLCPNGSGGRQRPRSPWDTGRDWGQEVTWPRVARFLARSGNWLQPALLARAWARELAAQGGHSVWDHARPPWAVLTVTAADEIAVGRACRAHLTSQEAIQTSQPTCSCSSGPPWGGAFREPARCMPPARTGGELADKHPPFPWMWACV